MDLSRISRGKLELRRERIELSQVVKDAVESSQPFIEKLGQQLTVTVPHHQILLYADSVRLAQVLLNLLNNAAKFSEAGGRIDLSAEQQGGELVVSVKDTGIGIPANKLSSIFEMFSQVENTISHSRGGLGIGLCLVKQIVEMHHGNIEARSDGPDKGSEFIVRLPIVAERSSDCEAQDNVECTLPTSISSQ
jgi:signal transduction histidine kinase